MIPVLMHTNDALMIREESVSKLSADIKALLWSDRFILVKTDYIVGVHPAGVLSPYLLFKQEGGIHFVPADFFVVVWPGYINIALPDLVIAKDIFYCVSHPFVTL